MKDDEITLEGFLELNTMEAQDADGDPNDLWVTLENMGYNKALELDQVLFSGESSQKRATTTSTATLTSQICTFNCEKR